jgi:hypothetical protein
LKIRYSEEGEMMKVLLVRCVLLMTFLLLSAQAVHAADGAPAFNWTGPYAGLHLG